MRKIFILNGAAGAGKDTFANILSNYAKVTHISSITPVKNAAKALGWNGDKTAESRQFLCDFKEFLNAKSNYIWDYLDKCVANFIDKNKHENGDSRILLIDIRECADIEKAVNRYNAQTIFIHRSESEKNAPKNKADANVKSYVYDYYIDNEGSLEQFEINIVKFLQIVEDAYFRGGNITLSINDNELEQKPESQQNGLKGKIIAVDFDNTIAYTDYPKIIAPRYEIIWLLQDAHKRGAEIILNTCRTGKSLSDAVEFCEKHSVPITRVNANSPERIKQYGTDCRKISADVYIDDKNLSTRDLERAMLEAFESKEVSKCVMRMF